MVEWAVALALLGPRRGVFCTCPLLCQESKGVSQTGTHESLQLRGMSDGSDCFQRSAGTPFVGSAFAFACACVCVCLLCLCAHARRCVRPPTRCFACHDFSALSLFARWLEVHRPPGAKLTRSGVKPTAGLRAVSIVCPASDVWTKVFAEVYQFSAMVPGSCCGILYCNQM